MSGDSSPFSVEVDETHIVYDLKKRIKTEMAPTLDTVDADALTLYKINIDISDDEVYTTVMNEISRGIYGFDDKRKLIPSRKVSKLFEGDSGETIEVLVELPPGEPIDSRACGNVVPMAHIPQLDAPFHACCSQEVSSGST